MPLDPATYLDRGLLPRALAHHVPVETLTAPVEVPPPLDAAALQWQGEPLRPGVPPLPGWGHAQDSEVLDTFDEADVKDVFGEEEDYPFTIAPRRYNPLPTLLPRYWLPLVQTTPYRTESPVNLPFGVVLTGVTGTSDMAQHYGWGASLSYRTDANYLGGAASFTVNRFLPIYTATFSRRAVPFPMVLEDPFRVSPDGSPTAALRERPYWESRHDLVFNVGYSYKPRTSVFARYHLTFRDNLEAIPDNAYRPRIPIRGRLGRLSGGWRYAWAQPTRYAISREDGRVISLVGSVLTPWLGSEILDDSGEPRGLNQVQLTAELNEYVVNPWVPNHVLAMRAAAGAVLGSSDFLGTYQLGGSIGDSPFYVTPDEFRMLRGYGLASDVGDYYWLAGAEYRFPILRIERGIGTLPAYGRYISGVFFVDTGNAITRLDRPFDVVEDTLLGLGAELRFSAILGWNIGMTGRLGYATGLGELGYGPLGAGWRDPRSVYFRLGGSY
jgi:hypothetical protein